MLKLKEYNYDTDMFGNIVDNEIKMTFEIYYDKEYRMSIPEIKFKQLDEPLLKQTKEDEYATDVISEKIMRDMHAQNRQYAKEENYLLKEFNSVREENKKLSAINIDFPLRLTVKKIITDNPPYTTILFEDGTKKVVKAHLGEIAEGDDKEEVLQLIKKGLQKHNKLIGENGEELYDRDKGIMIALLEKIYGKKEFYKIMGWY